jgi:N-acetylglucosamine-6-phosphate deacetylase
MIVLSGADIVLPDGVLSPGTLAIDGDRIASIRPGGHSLHGHLIVPGLVDVHVHGAHGVDVFDEHAIAALAAILPRHGVTAFCPTTMACEPEALGRVLREVERARESPVPGTARVLPAHLESNFINPQYRGAQPLRCIRDLNRERAHDAEAEAFPANDVLQEIERRAGAVGIVTLAPEVEGGLDLVARFAARQIRVSLGHSGATYEQALDAVSAGATQATHLFNAMPPLHHRVPGLAGAVLQSDALAAELICDGVHVHPALVRTAIAAKRPERIMAISDGTAAAELEAGAAARLGGQTIVAREDAAYLPDGTLAGSVTTLDRVLRMLVTGMGMGLPDAVRMCSTTPARELGLAGQGGLVEGALADLVVLDASLTVVETYVGGCLAYSRNTGRGASV